MKTYFIPMYDCDSSHVDDTNRFLDNDEVPRLLSCDGVLGVERFELTDVEPAGTQPNQRWLKFLNFYLVSSPDVLASDAFAAVREDSAWSVARKEQMGAIQTKELTTSWQKRPSPWLSVASFRLPAPRALFVILRDFEPGSEEAANGYLDSELVPELLGIPGFLHCERFESLAAKADGAEEVSPQYMDVFDLAAPEVLSAAPYRFQQSTPSSRTEELLTQMMIRGCGVYRQRPSSWLMEVFDARELESTGL